MATVGELSELLDRMPLAIELAASQVRSMTPGEILDRLKRSPTELTGVGRRDDRHRTLRVAIEWSYALLDDDEVIVFDRLAGFVGGFTIEAASAVCAGGAIDERDVARLVDQLVAKSLVSAIEDGLGLRFLQFEALRQFAAERLEGRGETLEVRRTHVRYFTEQAARLRKLGTGPRQQEARSRFEREYTNFRRAFTAAIELGDGDSAVELATIDDVSRQVTSRILSWAAQALAVLGAERAPRRIGAAASASFAAIALDADPEAGEHWLRKGLEWVNDADVIVDPFLYGVEALLAMGRGDLDTLLRAGQESIEVAKETGQPAVQVYEMAAHAMFCIATRAPIDRDQCQRIGEDAVALGREVENPTSLDFALSQLAWIVHRRDPQRAAALRDEGLAIASAPVTEGLQASGRAILAVDLGEDPGPFLERGNRALREVRDLQIEHPMLLAAIAWVVHVERADLAAHLLGNLGDQQTPWLLLKRGVTDLARARELVATGLTRQEARDHAAAGANVSRATVIDSVIAEMGHQPH